MLVIEDMLILVADEWRDAEAFRTIIHLVSRVSSRLFVGDDLCRDMTWLNASRGKTDLFLQ